MPPFRPAALPSGSRPADLSPTEKESPMARSPFAPTQPQTTPATPASGSPLPAASFRPAAARSADAAERRTLVVGRGISVQGVVQDAERLVVEGTVEATMINATELAITQGGVFKGEVEVEEAEIAGTIDGTLTARHALIVRGTGRVLGTARCKRLQVEDGGQITGRIEMIADNGIGNTPKAD
ncbi:MAG TPA: polymer-forming cytoskeletal protein [Acidiphilium sp.]